MFHCSGHINQSPGGTTERHIPEENLMYRVVFKLVVCFLLVAFAATGAYALKLEYKYKQGVVFRYKVKEQMTANKDVGALVPNTDWDAVLVLKVNKILENGDAEITASYESGTMKALGKTRTVKQGDAAAVTLTVSKQGEIRDPNALAKANGEVHIPVESADDSDGAMTIEPDIFFIVLRSLFQTLPGKELKQGETWKQDVISPSMEGTVKAQFTLQKTGDDYQGTKAASILSTVDDKAIAIPGELSGDIKEKTTMLFAAEQGKVASVKDSAQITVRDFFSGIDQGEDAKKLDPNLIVNYTVDIALIPADVK